MKPRHSLLALAVAAMGTTGCFDTQRDETFADTVVHDDTEIRVLHASPDAPRVDLLLDGERKLEDLDYGQTQVLTPPADWYDVALEGRVGPGSTQTLLTDGFDRFDEDRQYDLLVAGSADEDDNTLRTVLLLRDEPEDADEDDEDEDDDDDESLSLRGVHLVESEDEFGELDVFINGNHDEPLTTLSYGDGSDSLELDEGVFRIRLQSPGSDEPVFDSGKRERFSAGEELLVAVVPNTSTTADEDGGSPVKVLILHEDEVKTVRNEAEQSSLRFVHAAAESNDLNVGLGGDHKFEEVSYTEAEPSDEPDGLAYIEPEQWVVDAAENNNGDEESKNIRFRRGHGRTVLGLNDSDDELDLKSVRNNDRSVATNARIRLFQASPRSSTDNGPGAIDAYLVPEGDCLGGVGVIEAPLFESLNFRKMSRYEPVTEGRYDLVVTRAGDTEQDLLCETVDLSDNGLYDMVFAGDGHNDGDEAFELIRIGGVPGS